MKTKILLLISILALSCVTFVSCQSPIKDLNLTGDIVQTNFKELISKNTVAKKDFVDGKENYQGYSLKAIFDKIQKLNFSNSVFIEGNDETVAEVDLDECDEVFLINDKEKGYSIKSPSHPPMLDIKGIKKLTVVSDLPTAPQTFNGVYAFDASGNKVVTTAGNMYKDSLTYINSSSFTFNGEEMTAKKYIKSDDKKINLNEQFEKSEKYVKIFGRDGGQTVLNGNKKTTDFGILTFCENMVNFSTTDKSVVIEDIVGVLVDDFFKSIGDVYDKVKTNLDNGQKAIIIEFDGFSLQEYEGYKTEFDFLKNFTPEKVTSVYPSISNVGLATLLTGKTPKENGVKARADKTPTAETIFGYAKKLNKKNTKQIDMAYFEGDQKMLNIEIEAVLHQDFNDNGRNDDDTFLTVSNNLDKDLIYAHFHSSDDEGSLSGPFSTETKKVFKTLDGYVRAIAQNFDGFIYVVSDHGMHETEIDSAGKGYHSTTTFNDMVVPFFTIDNRK